MGARPVSPPGQLPATVQRDVLQYHLAQAPRQYGVPRTRWTLATFPAACPDLAAYSPSGLWRRLRCLHLHWKRARDHLRSPDPLYAAKWAHITAVRQTSPPGPAAPVVLFQDEVTYYRQPTLAHAYAPAGRDQPRAERSYRANTTTRVVATLNADTGQVTRHQAGRINVATLVRFYEQLCHAYPAAPRLYVVQDNWPVHFHPDVLAALEPQEWPWPWVYPSNWPTQPSPAARRLGLPIQLLPLPTYASWLNPIEKLWRWLKQDVLHVHAWAGDLPELRRQVLAFLDQFAQGSTALLRYVGLLVPK